MVVVQNTRRQAWQLQQAGTEVKKTARQRGDGDGRRRWLDGQNDDTATEEGKEGGAEDGEAGRRSKERGDTRPWQGGDGLGAPEVGTGPCWRGPAGN